VSTETRIAEIHTKIMMWDEHGFPKCTRHDAEIADIKKDVDKHDKVMWGVAGFVIVTLIGLVLGGCV
jgi:hypothetical protein